MAIIGTQQDDDELNRPTSSSSPNAKATIPGQGAGGGFAGGTGSGSGQGATTGVAAAGPATGGGGYTNLSQYLGANQNTGATTGQAAENVVQQSADMAKGAQNTYGQSAANDITNAASGLGVDQGNIDKINNSASKVDQSNLDKINAGIDATTGNYTGPASIDASYAGPSQGAYNVSYGGPTTTGSFTGQTAANQTAALGANQAVQDRVGQAQGGQAGVASLLRDAYSKPGYTAGENNLDSFLAGGTEGGKAALAGASDVGNANKDAYSQLNNSLNNRIKDAQFAAQKTNNTYDSAIKDAQDQSARTQSAYDAAIKAAPDAASSAYKLAQQQAAQAAQAEAKKKQDAVVAEKNKGDQAPGAAQIDTVESGNTSTPANSVFYKNGLAEGFDGIMGQPVNGFNPVAPPITASPGMADIGQANIELPDTTYVSPYTTPGAANISTLESNSRATSKPLVPKAPAKKVAAARNPNQVNPNEMGFTLAHGGEIPSYAKILELLKEKKK